MQNRLHPQSAIIGGVVSAVLTTMILPAFGGNPTPHTGAAEPHTALADSAATHKQGNEPRGVVIRSQRFQLTVTDNIAYLLDTETGEVWRNRNETPRPLQSTRDFFNEKR